MVANCGLIMNALSYQRLITNVLTTRCTWICPECNVLLLFGLLLLWSGGIDLIPCQRIRIYGFSSNSSRQTNLSSMTLDRLKLISLNKNRIKGKSVDLLVFLEIHQPHVVIVGGKNIDSSVATSKLRAKYVRTMYSE